MKTNSPSLQLGDPPPQSVLSPRFINLASLVFDSGPGEASILLGCLPGAEPRPTSVSLAQLRNLVVDLDGRLERLGVERGASVALLRLPRTSELLVAVAYIALSARGCRVLFPMALERDAVASWLSHTGARAAIFSAAEVRTGDHEEDVALADSLLEVCECAGVPVLDLEGDLGASSMVAGAATTPADAERARSLVSTADAKTECLVLTTSGSSGTSRLVRYAQGALLRSCASWEHAGLFAPDELGGRGLSLLLGHSMGVRALWNAVWTQQPLVLITPEWFLEAPDRAAALLSRFKPEHVTGGTATFFALFEMARAFPGLKEECFRTLRTLVSSGTSFDSRLRERARLALGLDLHNALGTTETMQVTSTLAPGPCPCRPGSLGNPLPGVRLRLDPVDDGLFRLSVKTPFGAAGTIDGEELGPEAWLDTGDLLRRRDGDLFFAGRADDDFFSDGLGVKLSRLRLQQHYQPPPDHELRAIELFPLRHEPGLAALVFVEPDGSPRVETDPGVRARVRSFFESRMEALRGQLDDFELRHSTVRRFTAVAAEVPRTRKGTPRRRQIENDWHQVLLRLVGRTKKHPHIVFIDTDSLGRSASTRWVLPRLGELLRLLDLDKQFVAGHGDRLTYRDARGDHEVVDFVGGYGANLLGHRHPAILEAASRALANGGVPICDQSSRRPAQGALASRLAARISAETGRSYVIRLASTGAEAVEMALAHACLERDEALRRFVRDQKRRFGHLAPARVRDIIANARDQVQRSRPQVLALRGAFHGHTSGARALLDHAVRREPFAGLSGIVTTFVDRGDAERIAEIVSSARLELPALGLEREELVDSTVPFSHVIAAVAEPVQGEGGVHPVPDALFAALSGHGFPLIADEIQAGLGRTGSFLASPVVADYTLFSKSLGGGVSKIAALAIERGRYVNRFDTLYSSTFAGDALSSAVASQVLDVIDADDIPSRCARRGEHLREALLRVATEFPDIVREVRGRGLMIGIELRRDAAEFSPYLRALVSGDIGLGALAAAYLLNRHDVRVLPTLSSPDVLRVEPSAYIDDAAIERLRAALTAFCRALSRRDVAELVSFLLRDEREIFETTQEPEEYGPWSSEVEPPAAEAQRVAFIGHLVYPEREIAQAEPSLRELSAPARRALMNRLVALMQMKPVVAFARNLFGGRVWFCAIWIPADTATLETLHRMDYRRLETERLQEAVDLAADRGCRTVALGGYTSILSLDGTAVMPPPNVRLTSGNTFTAVVGARRIEAACARAGIDRQAPETRVAILGATGNIGNVLARRLLAAGFSRMVLIGRDPERVLTLRDEVAAGAPGAELEGSTELDRMRACNVIAIAINTNEPLVYPRHVAHDRPVLIADVSVPSAVSRHVRRLDRITVIPLAGTVLVPGETGFTISSHTTPGTAFCCAAEAMLLGLEPEATRGLRLTGRIDPAAMSVLEAVADRHGFLAELGDGGFRTGG